MSTFGDPLEVAQILSEGSASPVAVRAALLLDVPSTLAHDFDAGFTPEVWSLAETARRALRVRWSRNGRAPAEHARAAIIALAGDVRAVALRLGDRLSGLRRLREDRVLADEALHVDAPLAARFGLGALQREMEDLAFRTLDPEGYRACAKLVAQSRAQREAIVERVRAAVESTLAAQGVVATTTGRAKHLWSIEQKRRNGAARLHDLFGVRILVADDSACYAALGVVHSAFTPVDGRFKDYVARPKPNGYRSLHTTVRVPGTGDIVEIQIRTFAMHRVAQFGDAAHHRYKLRGASQLVDDGRHIFALTPRGEVRRLPVGATALDFAYAVHTSLGRGCVGAKVFGSMVAISTPLRTGDVVEILASEANRASAGQLTRVRTRRARNRIRAQLVAAVPSR